MEEVQPGYAADLGGKSGNAFPAGIEAGGLNKDFMGGANLFQSNRGRGKLRGRGVPETVYATAPRHSADITFPEITDGGYTEFKPADRR